MNERTERFEIRKMRHIQTSGFVRQACRPDGFIVIKAFRTHPEAYTFREVNHPKSYKNKFGETVLILSSLAKDEYRDCALFEEVTKIYSYEVINTDTA